MAHYPTEKNLQKRKSLPVPPEPMEYYAYAFRCPLCNTEFTSEVPWVASPRQRDTDLRPRYEIIDPLPAFIHSCPSCQYTAYRQGFGLCEATEEDGFPGPLHLGDRACAWFPVPEEEELEDLRRFVRQGKLVQGIPSFREPFGAERYLLGARCYDFLHEDEPLGMADYLLRASWCARAIEDQELERYCQNEALNRLEFAIEHDLLLETDRPRTLYLIGELLRRLGEYSRAVDHFSQMESIVDADEEEGHFFLSLAKRQILLAMVKSNINGFFVPKEVLKTERGRMLL